MTSGLTSILFSKSSSVRDERRWSRVGNGVPLVAAKWMQRASKVMQFLAVPSPPLSRQTGYLNSIDIFSSPSHGCLLPLGGILWPQTCLDFQQSKDGGLAAGRQSQDVPLQCLSYRVFQ